MPNSTLTARKRPSRIAIGAIAIVVVLVIWQWVSWGSAFTAVEDWLFAMFGRRFPAASAAMLMLLPIAAIFLWVASRNRREVEAVSEEDLAMIRGERLLRVLSIATGTTVAAVLVVLLGVAILPSESGPRRAVDARTATDPQSGAVTLSGTLIRGRTVQYEKRIGLFSRTYQLVPLVPARADGGALRYFVELPELSGFDSGTHGGLLIRNGLPHDARLAFEGAGYRVAAPNALLFHDGASLRWPYFALAVQLLVVAAALLLATTLQWLVLRRIRRAVALLP